MFGSLTALSGGWALKKLCNYGSPIYTVMLEGLAVTLIRYKEENNLTKSNYENKKYAQYKHQ